MALKHVLPQLPVIVLAHNLTPSETANLSREFVRGFATEVGGPRAVRSGVCAPLARVQIVTNGSDRDGDRLHLGHDRGRR